MSIILRFQEFYSYLSIHRQIEQGSKLDRDLDLDVCVLISTIFTTMPSLGSRNPPTSDYISVRTVDVDFDNEPSETIPLRKIPSDENIAALSTRLSILGFTNPLTFQWLFSVVGAEYCHIYFWVSSLLLLSFELFLLLVYSCLRI